MNVDDKIESIERDLLLLNVTLASKNLQSMFTTTNVYLNGTKQSLNDFVNSTKRDCIIITIKGWRDGMTALDYLLFDGYDHEDRKKTFVDSAMEKISRVMENWDWSAPNDKKIILHWCEEALITDKGQYVSYTAFIIPLALQIMKLNKLGGFLFSTHAETASSKNPFETYVNYIADKNLMMLANEYGAPFYVSETVAPSLMEACMDTALEVESIMVFGGDKALGDELRNDLYKCNEKTHIIVFPITCNDGRMKTNVGDLGKKSYVYN